MQNYGICHIGNKILHESLVRKSFYYQIAEFCCYYKFWEEALALNEEKVDVTS